MMTDEQDIVGKIEIRTGGEDAITKTEVPLRILVLGDFTPEAPEVQDWSASSFLLNVTPGTFQSVMQELKPRLSFDVRNRVSESPKELTVGLSFLDMKAFRPEGIVEQVAELASLLEMRRLISQVKDGNLTLEEFDEKMQQVGVESAWLERFHQMLSAPQEPARPEPSKASPPEPKSEQKGSTLDSLLSKIDLGDGQDTTEQAERGPIDDLLRAVTQSKKGSARPAKSAVDAVIDELDQTLSDELNDILHHEKFQQLESTWRGLRFLIDRTDFRENIRIEVLPVRKSQLRDAIYHQVLVPEYNEVTETPLSVMIADYEFDRSPEDVELLGDIAEMCASIHVPFIASVGPAFFGSQAAEGLAKLPVLRSYFKGPEYAEWNALRDNEDSQYIALTMPRYLLRFLYGSNGIRVKGFNFAEKAHSVADHLWGRGSFAVATTLVRSFVENGWCIQITGLRGGGVVENLPVWSYHTAGREVHIPLDVSFPQSREKEFMDNGFILLSSGINDNKVCILGAPTVYRPKKYTAPEETEQARLHATLPYQLFATRMAHYLRRILREVSTGLTAEQVVAALSSKLRSILAKPGIELSPDAVTVEVSDSEENPDYYEISLRVRPPFQILGRNVDLSLGLQLHR